MSAFGGLGGMKMLAKTLTLAVLLVTSTASFAAEAPPVGAQKPAAQTYDLAAVIKTALADHPSLRAGVEDVTAAEAKVRQVQAYFRPQINAEAGYTRLQDEPSFSVDNFGTMHFGGVDNWTANLGAQLPLYTGGKLEAMRSGAKAGVQISRDTLDRQRQTVAINAARAYYRLLEANRMVPVIEAQIKALEEVYRSAQAMQKQGVVAKIDVLRAQVALTGAQDSLEQLRAGQRSARAGLVEAMGLPPGTPIAITEQDTTRPVPKLTAALWHQAWDHRPDLKALAAQKLAAEAQVQIARSAMRPQIGLFARSEFERPTFYPDTGNLSGGIMIQQKLSDGGATRQAVAQAEANLRKLKAVDEQMRYGIAAQVQVTVDEVASARSRLDTVTPAVAVAKEALRLAQVGYAQGVTPLTDVLQAQAAMTKANADYEGALSALRQAFAEYDYAMGTIVSAKPATPKP